MGRIEQIIELAKKNPKKIVLPEAGDERVDEAIKEIEEKGIAHIVPLDCSNTEKITESFYELQKHKGMTIKDAVKTVADNPLYLAAMMVHLGMADGLVAGASYMSKDVIKAAMRCLGIDRSVGVISGVFVMELENCPYGTNGFFIFADCAVISTPSAKQLARIAISSGVLLKRLFDIKPKIAFLTYSSHGSAEGESVDRARAAVAMVREKRPDFIADGELQFDAAIIPEIQKRKAPKSPLKGEANVLIFPSLDAGNITYKAVERLGKARAVGPLLLGLNKPCSDLSRGCSTEDIIATVALTSTSARSDE